MGLILENAPAQTTLSFKESHMSKVLFKTSLGDIELTLNAEKAPKTVENFLSYVKSGHYNDTIFQHRSIYDIYIQI